MRKLKSSSVQKQLGIPEDGERVIRKDGSVAIKVRTKKRRSVQTKKKEEKKSNKGKLILLAVVIALILLSAIIFFILLGYFNGSRFKAQISQTLVNVSGAEVELGGLDVSPTNAKLTSIDLKWSGEDTLVKSLKLNKINADYGILAFVGGGWGPSALVISQADLVLEKGVNNPRFKTSPDRPVDFKFNLYQCSELNVDFGEGSLWSLKHSSVSYRVSDQHDQLNLDSGDLTVPQFGKFKVQTGSLSFESNEAQVYLDLESEEHLGSLSVDGTVGYSDAGLLDLKIELRNYPLRDWIDPRARRFFNGKIHTSKGALKMSLGDLESLDIEAEMNFKALSVTDFAFIKTISEHLQDAYYLRPDFINESRMKIKWIKNRIEITDIDFLQNNQMRIKGNFTIDERDQLSGTLKVGIPNTAISRNREIVLQKTFKENDGEYIWATVIISGDVANPKDNLSEMIQADSAKKSDIKRNEDELLEQEIKELSE